MTTPACVGAFLHLIISSGLGLNRALQPPECVSRVVGTYLPQEALRGVDQRDFLARRTEQRSLAQKQAERPCLKKEKKNVDSSPKRGLGPLCY